MEESPALKFLHHTNQFTSNETWKMVDRLRYEASKHNITWPKNVFIPSNIWHIVPFYIPKNEEANPEIIITAVQKIAIVGTWRLTQDIVKFDEDIYNSIIDTPITGDIPSDILYHLPAWCIFVETQNMYYGTKKVSGFFALYIYRTIDKTPYLGIYFLADDCKDITPIILDLNGKSVLEALNNPTIRLMEERNLSRNELNVINVLLDKIANDSTIINTVTQAINLLLYICSNGLPNRNSNGSGKTKYHTPTKTKKGWRLSPAQRPTYHTLGIEIGEAIRAYKAKQKSDKPRAAMRPHVRRAHWHGYWSGSRKEEVRNYTLHWLPPIPVAMKEDCEEVIA